MMHRPGQKTGFPGFPLDVGLKKRVSIDKEFMPIVFCSLEIHLPHSHSLKEKRSVLRKVVDRLRSRFNFSVSEIETSGAVATGAGGSGGHWSQSNSVGRIVREVHTGK